MPHLRDSGWDALLFGQPMTAVCSVGHPGKATWPLGPAFEEAQLHGGKTGHHTQNYHVYYPGQEIAKAQTDGSEEPTFHAHILHMPAATWCLTQATPT
ncbi:hypothetical protein AAEP93_009824 [Penicillium crustosum]